MRERLSLKQTLYVTAVFLERIVMPLSLSRSFESMILCWTVWFSLKMFDCASIASTKVVLP